MFMLTIVFLYLYVKTNCTHMAPHLQKLGPTGITSLSVKKNMTQICFHNPTDPGVGFYVP